MSKIGKALYMAFAVIIVFLIFSSIIKSALFSASWFNPERTAFPVVFYSAAVDFIVLITIYSLIHNVRLYHGCFSDDITFLAGLSGIIAGWLTARGLSVLLSAIHDNGSKTTEITEKPGWGSIAIVVLTLAAIVITREIILRGFMYQYLSEGLGDTATTWGLPLIIALAAGHLERFTFVEFINIFLFNVFLCYGFRLFRDLWLPTAFVFTFYLTAFFTRMPIRELQFLQRANLLTGLERSWFGNEITIFAGIPLTLALLLMIFIVHNLSRRNMFKPFGEMLDYKPVVKRPRLYAVRDPYIRY